MTENLDILPGDEPWRTNYVSYSELSAFRQCPMKHRLSYTERWSSDAPKAALDRGTVWDAMMQTHYAGTMGTYPIEEQKARTLRTLTEAGLSDPEDESLLAWMYDGYLELYGPAEPSWRVLANQYSTIVPLPDPDDPAKDGPYGLKIKVDRVAILRASGQIWIWDDKTGKQQPGPGGLAIDDQFKLYQWGLRRLGKKVGGFMVNHARTQRNKTPMTMESRFVRHRLATNDRELATVAMDAAVIAAEIHREGRREYTNPNSASFGGCTTFCDFYDAHLLVRGGMDERSALTGFGFTQRERTQH